MVQPALQERKGLALDAKCKQRDAGNREHKQQAPLWHPLLLQFSAGQLVASVDTMT